MSARTKTTIGFILLFLFGMIFGVAATLIVEGGVIKKALANPDRGWELVSRRMSRELDLSREQRAELDAILLDTADGLQRIREQAGTPVNELLENSRGRIEKILTAEQREKFQTMFNRLQKARERYWGMGMMRRMHGADEEGAGMGERGMPMHRRGQTD